MLEPIRRAARRRGLCANTAVALVIERRLALRALESSDPGSLEVALDRRSEEPRTSIELWSPHGAYLRHLLRGDDLERKSDRPLRSPRVALPIRLIDRLGAESPTLTSTSAGELELAVKWEVAALLCGETLTEWAYRCALLEAGSRELAGTASSR